MAALQPQQTPTEIIYIVTDDQIVGYAPQNIIAATAAAPGPGDLALLNVGSDGTATLVPAAALTKQQES